MPSRKTAVFPGVFDPVTLGHLDIIRRGAALFDRLIVAVSDNPEKQPLFSLPERLAMVRDATADVPGVTVDAYEGLTVDYVARQGAAVILRGLRQQADFDTEAPLALTNRAISGIETILVLADPRLAFITSRLVREVARFGGDVSSLVPAHVAAALKAKIAR